MARVIRERVLSPMAVLELLTYFGAQHVPQQRETIAHARNAINHQIAEIALLKREIEILKTQLAGTSPAAPGIPHSPGSDCQREAL